jgi:hypothetical protein
MQKTFFKHSTGFFFVEDVLSARLSQEGKERDRNEKILLRMRDGNDFHFLSREEFERLTKLLAKPPKRKLRYVGFW